MPIEGRIPDRYNLPTERPQVRTYQKGPSGVDAKANSAYKAVIQQVQKHRFAGTSPLNPARVSEVKDGTVQRPKFRRTAPRGGSLPRVRPPVPPRPSRTSLSKQGLRPAPPPKRSIPTPTQPKPPPVPESKGKTKAETVSKADSEPKEAPQKGRKASVLKLVSRVKHTLEKKGLFLSEKGREVESKLHSGKLARSSTSKQTKAPSSTTTAQATLSTFRTGSKKEQTAAAHTLAHDLRAKNMALFKQFKTEEMRTSPRPEDGAMHALIEREKAIGDFTAFSILSGSTPGESPPKFPSEEEQQKLVEGFIETGMEALREGDLTTARGIAMALSIGSASSVVDKSPLSENSKKDLNILNELAAAPGKTIQKLKESKKPFIPSMTELNRQLILNDERDMLDKYIGDFDTLYGGLAKAIQMQDSFSPKTGVNDEIETLDRKPYLERLGQNARQLQKGNVKPKKAQKELERIFRDIPKS